ncbi:ABC transporter permease [Candidatus Chlorohelix sp.]|uniref:ABC transporter permease n=1 Tax=Candidatus Chlorohelix sp. TaxID=3139201 RepID=UPI00306521DD
MQRFIIRRLLQAIVLLWAVMSLSFLLINLAPGGPEAALTQNPRITKEQIQAIRASFGLDKPLYEQYVTWMVKSFTLDFGKSFSQPISTWDAISGRILPTLQLGLFSYLIGMLGIPIGIYAAKNRGKMGDNVVRILTVVGSCMPVWWLSLLLIIILANTVKWFPQNERPLMPTSGTEVIPILSWFGHLMIPAALLSSGTLIAFTRFVRAETLEVLSQDYVRTAESKGLPPKQVNRWHVLRNSLIPIVTLLGYFLPSLLSGAIITETIFNWPGMGRLYFQAAGSRDTPVLLAILFMTTIATILGTLLADIGYGLVDPRVRYT